MILGYDTAHKIVILEYDTAQVACNLFDFEVHVRVT